MGCWHPIIPIQWLIPWVLSFENIKRANPAAAELLLFCAFLDPDLIPEELFGEGALELGPELEPLGSDALALNDAISEVLKYSLLRRDANNRTLEIHRLVQAVLKQTMDQDTRCLWAERAVRAVERAFPSVEFSTWAVCERLLPHAYACAELIQAWSFEFPEAARLLSDAGLYMQERARYTDAEPLFKRALLIWERTLEPEDPKVAQALNDLAQLYFNQGKYPKAKPLFEQALSIREKALGPQDADVAESLNNLALLHFSEGKYAEAEPLYEQALSIWETVLGPEDPKVATSLNNVAELYRAQGQYTKAEPLYKRALSIREESLGPEHPRVATSLNNLASLYNNQGEHPKAEPLFERALAIWERALGCGASERGHEPQQPGEALQ